MNLMGTSANDSGLVSASLETCQSVKKKHVDMIYSKGTSYKKPKKSIVNDMVNSSAKLLSIENIGCTGVKPVVYAVICFENKTSKLAVIGSVPVFKSVNLHWAGLFLACCVKCKQFGYIFNVCLIGENSGICVKWVVTDQNWVCLTSIYKKKQALVICPVFFDSKTWAQVVGGFLFHVALLLLFGASLFSGPKTSSFASVFSSDFDLYDHLASLKCSLELLADQISGILKKMSFTELVPLVITFKVSFPVILVSVVSSLKSDMALNGALVFSALPLPVVNDTVTDLSLSNTKVLTTKIGGLKSKMVALKADDINFFIAKTVNESFFIILGGNFNEDGSHKYASFKKCLNLELVNSLVRSLIVKMPTWVNSRGVIKTIDYMFVSSNLVNAIVYCNVLEIGKHFDMDYQAVFLSVGLDKILNTQLNSFCKQVNKNRWKFDFKNADKNKWTDFKNAILANTTMFLNEFVVSTRSSDLDAMWYVIHRIMILLASGDFDSVFTKEFSRFHKLKLLVSKIVKASHKESIVNFVFFMKCWDSLNKVKALSYHASKFAKSLKAKKMNIRSAIDKRMESFEVNKGHTIKSVLECLFCKVVLDHLVVNNKLILGPELVKSKVDVIMKGWTRKHQVLLEYVFNEAFSGIMCLISFNELFGVVFNLPEGKAASLLDISNELWKHYNKSVLDMLLVLLNSYLSSELVPGMTLLLWINFMIVMLSVVFFDDVISSPTGSSALSGVGFLNILRSSDYACVCNHLSWVGSSCLSVYIDGSLKKLGTAGYRAGATVFFKNIDMSLGIGILGLMSFTLVELQAIVLALKCVFYLVLFTCF
ncbi:hypothetical protein G9A89_006236 [Geosiphon pyriformis]|nr:hypothetical protein G9A89_006236 [Geosiphon pyriformis]